MFLFLVILHCAWIYSGLFLLYFIYSRKFLYDSEPGTCKIFNLMEDANLVHMWTILNPFNKKWYKYVLILQQ